MKKIKYLIVLLTMMITHTIMLNAQTFVHPGGVHSMADLDRIKAKVLAQEHPWIDGWNNMIQDSKAQNTYIARPSTTIGGSDGTRQQAARDATAAYYNLLRWHVTGDTTYARCAINILNAWSNKINAVVTGELFQLPIMGMVQAAEIARTYPGWAPTDIAKFKYMCLNYFYPACHNFIGGCGSWSGWDFPAAANILYIGIFCDDQVKFNEAIDYYKNGAGGGNINNMVPFATGQIAEMGRDQPHAEIGPGCAAEFCQSAYNQGIDLFSYADNKLLSAFEYFSKHNLNYPTNWTEYNDCVNNHFYYPASLWSNRISANPQFEIIYNHYVVRKGLNAPYTKAMLKLRGIYPTAGEYIGYNALSFTLDATQSPFTPLSIPAAPTNLTAKASISRVELSWTPPAGDVASGYVIQRSMSSGSGFQTIATNNYEVKLTYIDEAVTNGTTYYYRVAAINNVGTSSYSSEISIAPLNGSATMPQDWALRDIGTVPATASATYNSVNNKTFIIKGTGSSFGGSTDAHGFAYVNVSGDFTISARLHDADLSGTNADRIGIIMRESFNPNATMASIGLHDNGFRKVWFTRRTSTGGGGSWTNGNTHTWLTVWFKLKRTGNVFTAYQSQDGITWFEVGSATIPMANTSYYAGLFVSNGWTGTNVTTAYFDNITTTGTILAGNNTPVAPTGVNLNRSNNKVIVNWNAVDGATSYNIKRANSSTGTYTTIGTAVTNTYADSSITYCNANNVFYVVSAVNQFGESSNATANSLSIPNKLSGTIIGTPGSWGNVATATKEAAVDGNINTFFDAPVGSAWVGYDLGVWGTITKIRFAPRSTNTNRMIGGVFQGSNSADFSNPTTLVTVSTAPTVGVMTEQTINNSSTFRYIRYLSPSNGFGNIAEIEFYGTLGSAPQITSSTNITSSVDSTFNYVIVANNSPTITSATGLPAGLSLNTCTGYITGTPTISGTFTATIGASNAFGVSNATLTINVKANQIINLGQISTKYVGDTDFDVQATVSSGLAVSYTSSDTTVATILNGKIHIVGAGSTTITASQGGNATYNKANSISQLLTVLKQSQDITFSAIPSKFVDDSDFDAGAITSSGLPVTYVSSDTTVAKTINNKIQIIGVGITTITASQIGNSTYNPASEVSQTFTVHTTLKIKYQDGDRNATNNQIKPYLTLVNESTKVIPLNEITIRYWLTPENYAGINTFIDYSPIGNNNVKITYVALPIPRNGALGYVEYSFLSTAGNINANGISGIIQSRLANADWSSLNETDDYSWLDASSSVFQNKITVYRNGKLIWGIEPSEATISQKIKVYSDSKTTTNSNTISTFMSINNDGNIPLDYKDLKVRYWFTKEGNTNLNAFFDYIKLGNGKVYGNFVSVNPARQGGDSYFEIGFNESAGTLYPLSNSGNINYRIAKLDWSNFNQSNDYSYSNNNTLLLNEHITIYYKGILIAGEEPSPATENSNLVVTGLSERNLTTHLYTYPNPVNSNTCYVKITGDITIESEVQVRIYNFSGTKVLDKTVSNSDSNTLAIDLPESLTNGVYLIQVNQLPTSKIILQR